MSRKDKRLKVYTWAVEQWGIKAQMEMLQEEATELALAARRFVRKPSDKTEDDLAEEVADVEIMIEQLKAIGGKRLVKQIGYIKRGKIKRLKDRLERE